MNIKEKRKHIQNLCEDDLRRKVLIPLLSKLGYLDPIHNHHSGEKGKDIVCKEFDPIFKKTRYLAVVVKTGDITGSSSSVNGYLNVVNQIRQAFNEPYKHPYDLKEVSIDRCLLITNGHFLPTAFDSICGTLKSDRLDKLIVEAIDLEKLISLVDENFDEYWSEVTDETESLINQRNHLLNNLSKLIKIIIREKKDQEKTLSLMSQSDIEFDLYPYERINRYIANIGYDKIEIDEIDDYYSDAIDNRCCDIKDHLFNIKKDAKSVLYDIDDVVEILKQIVIEKDPSKIIEYCGTLGNHVNCHGHISINAKELSCQDDFSSAIEEYRTQKEALLRHNVYDLYMQIRRDITDKCKKGAITLLNCYQQQLNKCLGYKIIFSIASNKIISSEIYESTRDSDIFQEDDTLIKYFGVAANTNGRDEISVEVPVIKYGTHDMGKKNITTIADSLLWHFERPVFDNFFKILDRQ
jgi:hypothetical protein